MAVILLVLFRLNMLELLTGDQFKGQNDRNRISKGIEID